MDLAQTIKSCPLFFGVSDADLQLLLAIIRKRNCLKGEVLFEGRNIISAEEDLINLRIQIGMIFQKPTAFPMSIFDNVAFGLKYRDVPKPEVKEKVEKEQPFIFDNVVNM